MLLVFSACSTDFIQERKGNGNKMLAYKRGGKAPHNLNLGSKQLHAPVIFLGKKVPLYPLGKAGLDVVAKEKITFPCRKSNP
jgi:hypothetical protein